MRAPDVETPGTGGRAEVGEANTRTLNSTVPAVQIQDVPFAKYTTAASTAVRDVAAELSSQIIAEHDKAFGMASKALNHARRAGELLMQAKVAVGHGKWLPWLAANVPFSERTARSYMRLSTHWGELQAKSANVADLALRDALALLVELPQEPITAASLGPGLHDLPWLTPPPELVEGESLYGQAGRWSLLIHPTLDPRYAHLTVCQPRDEGSARDDEICDYLKQGIAVSHLGMALGWTRFPFQQPVEWSTTFNIAPARHNIFAVEGQT